MIGDREEKPMSNVVIYSMSVGSNNFNWKGLVLIYLFLLHEWRLLGYYAKSSGHYQDMIGEVATQRGQSPSHKPLFTFSFFSHQQPPLLLLSQQQRHNFNLEQAKLIVLFGLMENANFFQVLWLYSLPSLRDFYLT